MIDLARFGDAPAIETADGQVVTYRALDALVDRYTRGGIVEVPAERTVDFIARCLGAWRGGGAFMPVDAADPRPRPRLHGDFAYAITTSGSTGKPKVVLVGHHGLTALWRTQVDAFALGPGARSLWLYSPLFDASISDWGCALSSGATLVIPTTNAVAQISRELAARAITHVDLPPQLLGQLQPPPSLRVVVLGGEACDVDRVSALARELRVVVVYGPTEATVCSSLVVVDPDRWTRPLIGQPLPGVTYRVIDGELHIGGDALALGYDDPEETARRFVEIDGTRMYRTGDRVESTPHGLAFVGRVDRQVKLRGRRVELDEIELALRRFCDAAVIVHRDRVVAFVEQRVDRRALALPSWMLPSRFVVGPLPRTPTGKIDRDALVVPPPKPTDPLALAWCHALGVDDVADDDRFDGDSLARLMLATATGFDIVGAPTFAELRARANRDIDISGAPAFAELRHAERRAHAGLSVAECEARGLAAMSCAAARLSSLEYRSHQLTREYRSHQLREAAGEAISPSVREIMPQAQFPGQAVLITGAAGFLGRALVAAWRRHHPGQHIIGFVRGDIGLVRDDNGRARSDIGRGIADLEIELVRGDITAIPDALRERVATVVHCAATIQLGGDWVAHEAANVRGTAEVARFAAGLPWIHVSTLSVFVHTDHARGRHLPADLPRGIAYGGYAQTKIAAEAIARASGASIYRLGLLAGGDHDQLAMTLRALAKLGAAPAGFRDERYDETPVEYAADAIARAMPGTHHVSAGSVRFGDVIDRMGLAELPHPVWLERARADVGDPDVAMAIGAFSRRRELDLFLATHAEFS